MVTSKEGFKGNGISVFVGFGLTLTTALQGEKPLRNKSERPKQRNCRKNAANKSFYKKPFQSNFASTKKEEVIHLKTTGANILNFQILWSLLCSLSIVAYALMKINAIPFYFVPLYLWISLYVLNVIFAFRFAYQTWKGKKVEGYPKTIKFVK